MPRVLVLFAHPRLERSRANRALLQRFPKHKHITFHDLYEAYPELDVDVRREQALVSDHDILVLHHPFYWYSMPPLLKQWVDLVYSFGWAYGPGGTALQGKTCFHVLTSGGNEQAYSTEGFHGHTLREFMLPLERTATLCGMTWLPPFAVQGSNKLDDQELGSAAAQFSRLLTGLADGSMDPVEFAKLDRLNEAVPLTH